MVVAERGCDEATQAAVGVALAGIPFGADTGGPIDAGEEREVRKRRRIGPMARGTEAARRGDRRGGRCACETRPPVGREYLKRAALLVADGGWIEEQAAVERLDSDAGGLKFGLDHGVLRSDGGFDASVPKYSRRSGGLDQIAQDARRSAASESEARADSTQRVGEFGERVMQPPTGCAAGRRLVVFGRRPDEKGDYGAVALRSRGERRVVAQAQVATEPDDDGRYGGNLALSNVAAPDATGESTRETLGDSLRRHDDARSARAIIAGSCRNRRIRR